MNAGLRQPRNETVVSIGCMLRFKGKRWHLGGIIPDESWQVLVRQDFAIITIVETDRMHQYQ